LVDIEEESKTKNVAGDSENGSDDSFDEMVKNQSENGMSFLQQIS